MICATHYAMQQLCECVDKEVRDLEYYRCFIVGIPTKRSVLVGSTMKFEIQSLKFLVQNVWWPLIVTRLHLIAHKSNKSRESKMASYVVLMFLFKYTCISWINLMSSVNTMIFNTGTCWWGLRWTRKTQRIYTCIRPLIKRTPSRTV